MKAIKKNIFILDDDPRICEELSEYLMRKNYRVFSSDRPSTAFQILSRTSVDMLFLDFTLPEIDGLAVLKKVKKLYPNMQVIIISGDVDLKTMRELENNGAIGFIQKPFLHKDVNQILQKINPK